MLMWPKRPYEKSKLWESSAKSKTTATQSDYLTLSQTMTSAMCLLSWNICRWIWIKLWTSQVLQKWARTMHSFWATSFFVLSTSSIPPTLCTEISSQQIFLWTKTATSSCATSVLLGVYLSFRWSTRRDQRTIYLVSWKEVLPKGKKGLETSLIMYNQDSTERPKSYF